MLIVFIFAAVIIGGVIVGSASSAIVSAIEAHARSVNRVSEQLENISRGLNGNREGRGLNISGLVGELRLLSRVNEKLANAISDERPN